MPIPSTTKWPRPKSEDEWEDMVLDAMRIFWNDPNAYRYGRNGQSQNGVDIIGKQNLYNVAAQAKNCDSISKQQIKVEIDKAKNLFIKLDELYFVISGNRDSKLQELVHLLSIENIEKNNFKISILFFDDVCQHLTFNSNLIKKYWQSFLDIVPQIFNKSVLKNDDAISAIYSLNEFQILEKEIENASSGEVNLSLRIERAPNLEADSDLIERSWQIAISENHKTHRLTLWRFSVNVDNGTIHFFSVLKNEWILREDWKENELY